MPINGGVPRELEGFPKRGLWAGRCVLPRRAPGRRGALRRAPRRGRGSMSGTSRPAPSRCWSPSPTPMTSRRAGSRALVRGQRPDLGHRHRQRADALRRARRERESPLPAINAGLAVGRSGRVGIGTAWDGKSPSLRRFSGLASTGAPRSRCRIGRKGSPGWPSIRPRPSSRSPDPRAPSRSGRSRAASRISSSATRESSNELTFSPDGKWLASAGDDQTVRLWPVPDMKEVPPHRRSHEEFLATLRTFTNVRAVPDPKAPNGWKLELGNFPRLEDRPALVT